ncbi:MAG TPA: DUF2652 domain-containing protein [Anaerolineae bacterium]|nr:DUF2652 domain-containing protein [Anaerolineae bacterium]
MKEQGYLLAVGITDYLPFLQESELAHGQAIIDDLLNGLYAAANESFPFVKVEQTTLYVLAPFALFSEGQVLVELVEHLYGVFAQQQGHMAQNTQCVCQACKSLPMLDTQIVIHCGEYVVAQMAAQSDVLGLGMGVVRALSAQRLEEATYKGKAFWTEDSQQYLGGDLLKGMASYEVEVEGKVIRGVVCDLRAAWEEQKASRKPILVEPDEVMLTMSVDLPVPLAVAWDYIADTKHRQFWLQADKLEVLNRLDGRVAVDSQYVCMHGNIRIDQVVVDWRPLEYITMDVMPSPYLCIRQTARLEAIDEGTRIIMDGKLMPQETKGRQFISKMMFMMAKGMFNKSLAGSRQKLIELVQEEQVKVPVLEGES